MAKMTERKNRQWLFRRSRSLMGFSVCGFIQRQLQQRKTGTVYFYVYKGWKQSYLPRPISICEIDKEDGRLRVVYRVTGENTGTEEFSKLKTGDAIPIIGPLGNGFPFEAAEGKKVFLMGGGIGVPPILELAKQMKCDKKQIVVGYRDAQTFLKEEFEQNGELYISTERWKCRNNGKCYGRNP